MEHTQVCVLFTIDGHIRGKKIRGICGNTEK